MADLADARREAEEALAKWEGCRVCQTWKPVRAHALSLATALRALLAAGPEAPPPPSDAVREAAEIIRAILTGHSARLSERGVLIYGPPRSNTGFPAAIEWLRRYDAARGGE